MQINKLKLTGITLDNFVNFIIQKIEFDFESHSPKMSVLMKEEYLMFRNAYDCQTLVIKSTRTGLVMELTSVGGEAWLWDIFSNPEERFFNKVWKILEENMVSVGFEFEEMEI